MKKNVKMMRYIIPTMSLAFKFEFTVKIIHEKYNNLKLENLPNEDWLRPKDDWRGRLSQYAHLLRWLSKLESGL